MMGDHHWRWAYLPVSIGIYARHDLIELSWIWHGLQAFTGSSGKNDLGLCIKISFDNLGPRRLQFSRFLLIPNFK
jgi:hypothetical protein